MNAPDAAKLHAEINQSVNQRFLLTAAAITVFALISKSMIPSFTSTGVDIPEIMPNVVNYLAYISILGLLYYQSFRLRVIIRIYSTYLRARGMSTWEVDWFQFRNNDSDVFARDIARSDLIAHGIIFFGLAVFCAFVGIYLVFVISEFNLQIGIRKFEKEIFIGWAYLPRALLLIALMINAFVLMTVWITGRKPVCNEVKLLESWENMLDSVDICRSG